MFPGMGPPLPLWATRSRQFSQSSHLKSACGLQPLHHLITAEHSLGVLGPPKERTTSWAACAYQHSLDTQADGHACLITP